MFQEITDTRCKCGKALASPRAKTCGARSCQQRNYDRNSYYRGKLLQRPISVDGEGEDKRYTLLAASTKQYVAKRSGLSTEECFEFLMKLPAERLIWGFAFSYDCNMMFSDFTIPELERLAKTTRVYHGKWRVEHIPGKKLTITDREKRESRTVWDMFPWRQSSFVSMLEDWKLCDKATLERVAAMKDQRAEFANLSDRQIREYCLEECELLERAIARLLSCIKGSGYHISQFHSPGSLASAAMRRHEIQNYRAPYPQELDEVLTLVGGRSEAQEVGPIEGEIREADIHSAYPYAATLLPCFACGTWKRGVSGPWAYVRVRWQTRRGTAWGPYPVRGNVGSLRFPTSGETWVWRQEAEAGKPLCSKWEILDGWTYEVGCDHRPFAYLAELYDERRRLVAQGDPNEYTYKLILNSTYGKLAEKPRRDRVPRWRFLPFASLITSITRSMLLDAIVRYNHDVLLVATDCVITRCPVELDFGEGLGQWELKKYDNLFIVGPGFYYAGSTEKPKIRSRGIAKVHVDFRSVVEEWGRNGRDGKVTIPTRRFVGYKVALQRKDTLGLWRSFIDIPLRKSFSLYPRRLWLTDDPFDGRSKPPTLAHHNKTVIDDQDSTWKARLSAEFGTDLAAKLLASTRFDYDAFPLSEQPDWIIEGG